MKRTLYVCQCGSLEHTLFVCAEEEDFFLEVHLAPLPFWQRVRNAVGYVFGRRSRYGDFEEVLLSPEDAVDLGDRLLTWAGRGDEVFSPNDVY
jgi:hypothetical protein